MAESRWSQVRRREIGPGTAEALAANGARVAHHYHRNEAGAAAAREQIVGAGGSAIVAQANVTRASEVQSAGRTNGR